MNYLLLSSYVMMLGNSVIRLCDQFAKLIKLWYLSSHRSLFSIAFFRIVRRSIALSMPSWKWNVYSMCQKIRGKNTSNVDDAPRDFFPESVTLSSIVSDQDIMTCLVQWHERAPSSSMYFQIIVAPTASAASCIYGGIDGKLQSLELLSTVSLVWEASFLNVRVLPDQFVTR